MRRKRQVRQLLTDEQKNEKKEEENGDCGPKLEGFKGVSLEYFLHNHIKEGRRIFTLVASMSLIPPDFRPRFFIYANHAQRGLVPMDFLLVDENEVKNIPSLPSGNTD